MTRDQPRYFELPDSALIAFQGEDAAAFLHAQLTSDVNSLRAPATQYSGYCSPKGRLLATVLLWRLEDEILLQLPAALHEPIQSKLTRYVLRAKVKIIDASARYVLFGVSGGGAAATLAQELGSAPAALHQVASAGDIRISSIPGDRYVLLVPSERAESVRARLDDAFDEGDTGDWAALEVRSGIPVITTVTQDEYVPQMVNLDLVGGVSFSKGCYPGQEIVARMHYLGRLKQRLYRIRVNGVREVAVGDALFSAEFGKDQASGSILYAGHRDEEGVEALAVVQKASASSAVHLGALDGPRVEFLPLPYTIPD